MAVLDSITRFVSLSLSLARSRSRSPSPSPLNKLLILSAHNLMLQICVIVCFQDVMAMWDLDASVERHAFLFLFFVLFSSVLSLV